MVDEGTRNSEKQPVAAEVVVAEFNLRREKGSKISKLWLTTKMMRKIESCYGKEEDNKSKQVTIGSNDLNTDTTFR